MNPRGAIRRVESAVSEEMLQQRSMQQTFKHNSDFIQQLNSRVKRNEEQIQGGQVAVNSLMEQFRRVSQLVSNGQNNSSGRNDVLDTRLMELHSNMEEGRTERQQILGTAASLSDKVKSLEQRVESKLQELSSVSIEVRKKSLAVEDQTRTIMDQFKKSQEYQTDLDYSNHQLKTQVDTRIAEFQGILNDLKNKTMKDESERRNNDQLVNRKLSDMQFALSDIQRSHADLQHESSKVRQDMTTLFETESSKLNDQISRSLDDFRRKLHDTETKIKDESSSKLTHLEKSLNEERDSRLKGEKSIRDEMKETVAEMREKSKEDLQLLTKSKKAEKQKITDSLNVVNDAVNSVEKHQDEWFDKLAKSLRAEIKTREANTDSIQKQISDLDAKFAEALILIDKEGPIYHTLANKQQKPARATHPFLPNPPALASRRETVGELESNVKLLSDRISQLQSTMDEKSRETMLLRNSISVGNASGIDKINETLNQVIEWYSKSTKQVDDVNSLFLDKVGPRLNEVEREIENVKKFTMIKIGEEKSARSVAVNEVNREMKKTRRDLSSHKEECDSSVAKVKVETEQLAAALLHIRQTLKQSLEEQIFRVDMQIAEESKKKTEQIVQIRQDVNHLNSIVEANLVSTTEYNLGSNYGLQNMPTHQQLGQPENLYQTAHPVRTRERTVESRGRVIKTAVEVQTDNHAETQTYAQPKTSESQTKPKTSEKEMKPKSPGTAMQTIESFLQEMWHTNGNPNQAVQTGKSVLDSPPSPGVGFQTSFQYSDLGVIPTQTSPNLERNSTRASISSQENRQDEGLQRPDKSSEDSRGPVNPLAGMNFHALEGAQLEMVGEVEQKLKKEDSVYKRYLEMQSENNANGDQTNRKRPSENNGNNNESDGKQKTEIEELEKSRGNRNDSEPGASRDQETGIDNQNGKFEDGIKRKTSSEEKSMHSIKNPKTAGSRNSQTRANRTASAKTLDEPDADDLEYKSNSSKKRSLPIEDES